MCVCVCVYVYIYAGACLCSQKMGPLGCQLKQEAPFYIGKLTMWFPQSWQWKYERRRAALGGLPSPVLNDLLPHSQRARPRQRVSVCLERVCLRNDLSTVHPSLPPTVSPPPLHTAQPPVPPGPDIDAIIKAS